jgi:hypothetical protein
LIKEGAMNPEFYAPLFAGGLLMGTFALLESGRRTGRRHLAIDGENGHRGLRVVEGVIFGLLGLLIAFSFSGAMSRFDARRSLIVEESNAIGTAWLRLDLLKPAAQPALRELLRHYLDARLAAYRKLPDIAAAKLQYAAASRMEGEIWERAVAGARDSEGPQAAMLLLPAINQVIDLGNSEMMATQQHPPAAVFLMLALLALGGSFVAGYAMAPSRSRYWIHALTFSVIIAMTVYLILDIEHPLVGMIRIDAVNQNLVELRQSMTPQP